MKRRIIWIAGVIFFVAIIAIVFKIKTTCSGKTCPENSGIYIVYRYPYTEQRCLEIGGSPIYDIDWGSPYLGCSPSSSINFKNFLKGQKTAPGEVKSNEEEQYTGSYKSFLNNIYLKTYPKDESGKRKADIKNNNGDSTLCSWSISATDKSVMYLSIYSGESNYIVKGFIDFRFSKDFKNIIVIRSDFPDEIPVGLTFTKIY